MVWQNKKEQKNWILALEKYENINKAMGGTQAMAKRERIQHDWNTDMVSKQNRIKSFFIPTKNKRNWHHIRCHVQWLHRSKVAHFLILI